MLNHTINLDFGNRIYGMINMEAIPKFDIKSVIKSDIKFDISIKPTTGIGQNLTLGISKYTLTENCSIHIRHIS